MPATPIDQLKREALAGIRHHPDDLKAVRDAVVSKPVGVTPDGEWLFEPRILYRNEDGKLSERKPTQHELDTRAK